MIFPVLYTLLSVLSLGFCYFLAWLLCDPVLGWVYERARPKGYEVTTLVGERIEAIFHADFWSTTFIKVVEWSLKIFLLNLAVIAASIFLGGDDESLSINSILLFVLFVQVLVTVIVFPIYILIYDWNKRYSIRIVVTTTTIHVLTLRISLSALSTGDAPLLLKSKSRISDANRDLKIGSDIQDIDPSYKTGWFSDQIIALRASLGQGWHFWGGGVRSMLLLTFIQRGSDKLAFIYRGATLEKIIETSGPRANTLIVRQQKLQSLEADASLGRLGEDHDEAEAKQAFDDIKARSNETDWPSITFDPYTVADPGNWDLDTGTELVSYDLHGRSVGETVYVR